MKEKTTWALVTGASGGLGEAFARRLADEGWNLVLAARNKERLAALAESIGSGAGVKAETVAIDLSERGAGRRLHDECAGRGLEIGLLVNNAGSGLFGESVELPPDRVEAMLGLNVVALTELSSLFGKDMKARRRGKILNVASLAGRGSMPYFASYGATKSYVLNYSLALRAELKPYGVGVSCILPGYIRTSFDGNAGITSAAYRAFSDRNAMEADAVAARGLRLLARGRGYAIAGGINKLSALGMALLPPSRLPFLMKPFLDRLVADKKSAR
jgi:short-subunit dehydrogenase